MNSILGSVVPLAMFVFCIHWLEVCLLWHTPPATYNPLCEGAVASKKLIMGELLMNKNCQTSRATILKFDN